MAAETASRMPAATTPNTPKACLAIDAPLVSARPQSVGPGVWTEEDSEPQPAGSQPLRGLRHARAACRHGSMSHVHSSVRCAPRASSMWQKLRGDRVLHSGYACVGVALCTSPETRTRTTQHILTRPPRVHRLRDS